MTADGNYDIKDVDVSPDAKNVIFSMRGPIAKNANERKAPFWTLWEYTVATGDLHQVIDTTRSSRGRQRCLAALPARWQHRVLLDAPARWPRGAAR